MKNKIILITGVPGSGKSTIALRLANILCLDTLVSTDVIKDTLKVYAYDKKYGFQGIGATYGVVGIGLHGVDGEGVYGRGPKIGVEGHCTVNNGIGVYGHAVGATGTGVYGYVENTSGIAGYFYAKDHTHITGIKYTVDGVSVVGLAGNITNTVNDGYVYGINVTAENLLNNAMGGFILGVGTSAMGVYGKAIGTNGRGVYAIASGSTVTALNAHASGNFGIAVIADASNCPGGLPLRIIGLNTTDNTFASYQGYCFKDTDAAIGWTYCLPVKVTGSVNGGTISGIYYIPLYPPD